MYKTGVPDIVEVHFSPVHRPCGMDIRISVMEPDIMPWLTECFFILYHIIVVPELRPETEKQARPPSKEARSFFMETR